MTRKELLSSPEYWITKVQIALYNCAHNYMHRTKKNRTQLAEHLGVTKSYVSQLLNGDYDHRLSKFIELSMAFGYVPEITFKPIKQVVKADSMDYNELYKSLLSADFCPNIDYKKTISEGKEVELEAHDNNDNNPASAA